MLHQRAGDAARLTAGAYDSFGRLYLQQTLRERFDPSCGGGDRHGLTSHLSGNQIDDLVSYLETL